MTRPNQGDIYYLDLQIDNRREFVRHYQAMLDGKVEQCFPWDTKVDRKTCEVWLQLHRSDLARLQCWKLMCQANPNFRPDFSKLDVVVSNDNLTRRRDAA